MTLMKNIYLMMTVTVCSIFISLYIAGMVKGENLWFCLIPVGLVIRDFLQGVRTPAMEPLPRTDPRSPYYYVAEHLWEKDINRGREVIFEFIKEEEFKV